MEEHPTDDVLRRNRLEIWGVICITFSDRLKAVEPDDAVGDRHFWTSLVAIGDDLASPIGGLRVADHQTADRNRRLHRTRFDDKQLIEFRNRHQREHHANHHDEKGDHPDLTQDLSDSFPNGESRGRRTDYEVGVGSVCGQTKFALSRACST